MTNLEEERHLAYAVAEWLSSVAGKTQAKLSDDQRRSVQLARDGIAAAFGVDLDNGQQKAMFSLGKESLPGVFARYLRADAPAATEPASSEPSDEDRSRAADFKQAGNQKLAEKDYPAALALYSQAVELDPRNAMYLSNRAATHSLMGDHEAAVADAERAIEMDPSFSKAYGRLGHAAYCLGRFQDAIDAYTTGLELDPNNATFKKSLQVVRQKLAGEGSAAATPQAETPVSSAGAGANPLAAMGAGGMPDLGGMMGNSNFMDMASNLMSNPQFAQMAQNLMSNPEMMGNLANMFGGAGGAGGAGGRSA